MDDTEADPSEHKKKVLIMMNLCSTQNISSIAANKGVINNKVIASKKQHESRRC